MNLLPNMRNGLKRRISSFILDNPKLIKCDFIEIPVTLFARELKYYLLFILYTRSPDKTFSHSAVFVSD